MAGIFASITQDAILEFGMFGCFLFQQGRASEEGQASRPNFRICYVVNRVLICWASPAGTIFHVLFASKLDDACDAVEIYGDLPCIRDCQCHTAPLQSKLTFAF